jgi:hypothetical protein
MTRIQSNEGSVGVTEALRNALSVVPGDDLVSAKVRGLIRGYDARWSLVQDRFDVLSVEKTLTSQLLNPVTGRTSRSFTVAGKLDVIAVRSGRHVIVDHKTTSDDITDPNSPYWRQLIVESQASHYMLLAWINGMKVDEAIWDVVRKPSIRPKKLSAMDVRTAVFTKEYFGQPLTTEEILKLQRDSSESLEMYEARLADDCINERPDWYFARRSILRVDSELAEYSKELWDHGQDLLAGSGIWPDAAKLRGVHELRSPLQVPRGLLRVLADRRSGGMETKGECPRRNYRRSIPVRVGMS